MNKLNRILAVLDGTDADAIVMTEALALAHQHNAALELFLCKSERAYAVEYTYDPTEIDEYRRECLRHARRYLDTLRDIVVGADVRISVDVVCESPLDEAIVHKVLKFHPDLVIKNTAGYTNDRQLMRACPATLLLVRDVSTTSIAPAAVEREVVAATMPAERPATTREFVVPWELPGR